MKQKIIAIGNDIIKKAELFLNKDESELFNAYLNQKLTELHLEYENKMQQIKHNQSNKGD